MARVEYWSLFGWRTCSKHRTFAQAEKHAQACESNGGDKHVIYRVEKMKRSAKDGKK